MLFFEIDRVTASFLTLKNGGAMFTHLGLLVAVFTLLFLTRTAGWLWISFVMLRVQFQKLRRHVGGNV